MVEEVPVMMPERESAMAKAAAMENMSATKSATAEYGTAAKTTAVKGRTAPETAASAKMAAAVAASATMAAANFSNQFVGDGFRGRRRAWIDRRQCLSTLA